jgi:hypothetical protein
LREERKLSHGHIEKPVAEMQEIKEIIAAAFG